MDELVGACYTIDAINKSNISLDNFVGASIICKGFVGTTITLTGTSITYLMGGPITVNITNESKTYLDHEGIKYEIVTVPLGSLTALVQYNEYEISTTINAIAPQIYYVGYNLDKIIFNAEVAGSYNFVIPNDVSYIWVNASGAGAGGSVGGTCSNSSGTGGSGGSGGGGGAPASKSTIVVTPGTSLSITIGAGGRAGDIGVYNTAGGSTVISEPINMTLSGGAPSGSQNPGGAGGSGSSGGSKAPNGTNGYTFQNGVLGGIGGIGGSGSGNGATATGGGGGGGGGNSVNAYLATPDSAGGAGGDGAGYIPFEGTKAPTAGQNGTRGSGGGGGGGGGNTSLPGAPGGRGGDGFVTISSRIIV